MNLDQRTRELFNQGIQTLMEAQPLLTSPITEAGELIVGRLLEGGKILCLGTGTGASLAQAFSTTLLNHLDRERPGLPAISLCSDPGTLTAIGQDYDFDEIFAKQVRALGHPGDLVVALDIDGQSDSICAAIESAHEREMYTIALTGGSGGRLSSLLRSTDIEIRAPSDSPPRITELHLLALHCIGDLVDQQLLGS
jgi:D-sedoheptulose 7-phosphate isomerase